MTQKTILFAAQHLTPGATGIGRVARLSIMALSECCRLHALAVEDRSKHQVCDVVVTGFAGKRAAFAMANNKRLLSADLAIYDFPGTARAHRVPWRPYAVWVHGNEIWNEPEMRPDYKRAVRRASVVLVNSQHTLDAIRSAMGPLPNVKMCWLSTEQDRLPPKTTPVSGPPTLLFIGRNDAYFAKGQDTLVRIWPDIVNAIPDARLCLVGGGTAFDRLKGLVDASPCAANIDLMGFIPEHDMERVWQRATALALLGRLEGFGLVIVEAMRQGKPVITSTQDAGSEINVDGVTGYNVDRDDDTGIVSRITELLGNPALNRRMGLAGQQRWSAHFRLSAFAARFRDALAPMLSL